VIFGDKNCIEKSCNYKAPNQNHGRIFHSYSAPSQSPRKCGVTVTTPDAARSETSSFIAKEERLR